MFLALTFATTTTDPAGSDTVPVIEPRSVLREFGLEIDESVTVHVWDSSAEERYIVIPERPAGTDRLSEPELAALVSRDAMIGVARVTTEPVRSAGSEEITE